MSEFIYLKVICLSYPLQWIIFIAACISGFILLVKSADMFVDSSSNIAKIFKIPAIVVGLTIVAFGTSAPEASVSITAILNHSNGISVGNIVGSNIFNLYVILALSAIFSPVFIKRYLVKRDLLMMLISSILLVLFIFILPTGKRSLMWIEGTILLVIFIIYMIIMIKSEMKKMDISDNTHIIEKEFAEETFKEYKNVPVTILILLLSLVGIVVGGTFVNVGAKGVVINIGASENLAGLTVCAVGTSLPELVTSIVAIKKHENDIALGNVVGSNLFNVMFILGLCSIIAPIQIDIFAVYDIIILAVLTLIFYIYSLFSYQVDKKIGTIMLILYILYFVFIILREYIPII